VSLGRCDDGPSPHPPEELIAVALIAALKRWKAGRDDDRLAGDLEATIGLLRRHDPE
jgi:hypothetical protein